MSTIVKKLRAGAALLVSSSLLVTTLGTLPAEADTEMSATAGVNIRSGPSTSYRIVGGLYRGQTVTAVRSSDGWTKIRFKGGSAYIASQYLTTRRLAAPAGVSGNRVTTTAVNLRRGPSLSYRILWVVPDNTVVQLTGRSARGFVEVRVRDRRGWLSAQYLARTSGLPAVIGTRVATASLLIRTSSGSDARVVGEVGKGTRLSVTGTTQNGRAQIIYRSAVRWVTARYLSNTAANLPAAPGLPAVTGREPVVPKSIPSSWAATERRLTAKTIRVHRAARAKFPQIKVVGGYRPASSGEHPLGRALDFMIPNYQSSEGRALGTALADWARANAREYDINYVVWRQRIWNIQRDREGWRFMADRGNDSANHINHVHITVYP